MKEEDSQRKLQEKYIEFSMLDQRMKQIEKQIELISNQIVELTLTAQSIEDLAKVKEGTEILVPLSSGIFVKAELKDNQEMLINVGADAVIKKDIHSTKEFILKQFEEVRKVHQQLIAEFQKLAVKARVSEKELSELAGS